MDAHDEMISALRGDEPADAQSRAEGATSNAWSGGKDRAYWLADKIPALGDYAKEAAIVLRQQADKIEAQQATIDRLMLEYCPYEMTPEQIVIWARNQRSVPNGEVKAAPHRGVEP